MFTLKIHTVDFPQPLHTTVAATSSAVAGGTTNRLNPSELRGVAHLFRQLPPSSSASSAATSIANPNARTTRLFVVAVPNYFSADEFLLFCGSHLTDFLEIIFLRNDGMEDRYNVLVTLQSQVAADSFYCSFNGKRFNLSEVETCHLYFVVSVEFTDTADIASTPPLDFTELPTCPVCLERLDHDTSGIQSTLCDHSFQCSCVSKWTYLSCPVCRFCQQKDERPACAVCGTFKNLWVCLICGFVGCGRYEKGHASGHWSDKQHRFSLELEKQQIWDYVGDRYVHRLNQSRTDGKSVRTNNLCNSVGECGSDGCYGEEGLDGVLVSSKVQDIVDEYNHLLASQLDVQRKHYESLLAEAKSRKESSIMKAVEKAIFSKTHDLQYKLERFVVEKKAVAYMNQELTEKQELLQKKFEDIQEREILSIKSKDENIKDLQEQIRDLNVYVKAQKTLANMKDTEGFRGGTVLPVDSNQSSSGKPKRRTKTGGRRN